MWTPEELKKLEEFKRQNVRVKIIAREMGRSPASVAGRSHKMGFNSRSWLRTFDWPLIKRIVKGGTDDGTETGN